MLFRYAALRIKNAIAGAEIMRLEKYCKEDRDLYEQVVFNEKTMAMNLGRIFTDEEADFFFQAISEQNEARTEYGFYKALTDKEDGEKYIGMGAINQNDEYEAPEIEYMLLPQFWNKGYGTELVKLLMHMVKDSPKIIAITDPKNVYSRRILLKQGFESVKTYQNDDGDPAELFLYLKASE